MCVPIWFEGDTFESLWPCAKRVQKIVFVCHCFLHCTLANLMCVFIGKFVSKAGLFLGQVTGL